jgi:Holliday junction resolvase RusA-like endonuclease
MGRPKASLRGKGSKAHVHVRTPDKSRDGMEEVRRAWREAGEPRIDGDSPLALSCRFFFSRPKTHYKADGTLKDWAPYWYTLKKNDLDNLMKLVKDALNLRAYDDDGLICTYAPPPERLYVRLGEHPRTEVMLFPVSKITG